MSDEWKHPPTPAVWTDETPEDTDRAAEHQRREHVEALAEAIYVASCCAHQTMDPQYAFDAAEAFVVERDTRREQRPVKPDAERKSATLNRLIAEYRAACGEGAPYTGTIRGMLSDAWDEALS